MPGRVPFGRVFDLGAAIEPFLVGPAIQLLSSCDLVLQLGMQLNCFDFNSTQIRNAPHKSHMIRFWRSINYESKNDMPIANANDNQSCALIMPVIISANLQGKSK
jgi:hypothetical protein